MCVFGCEWKHELKAEGVTFFPQRLTERISHVPDTMLITYHQM